MTVSERNFNSKLSIIAVSAELKESALNTPQTLDTRLVPALGTVIDPGPRIEDDADDMTGFEEATAIHRLGQLSKCELQFNKAKPSDIAFGLAYGLGSVSTAAAGGTGYKHTITPTTAMRNPHFTAAMRYGSNIYMRRFASLFVNEAALTLNRDSWAQLRLSLMGPGKDETDYVDETVEALDNVTAIEVSNAVLGDDGGNVHQVKAELATGVWTEATITGASGLFILISSMGGAGVSKNYRCIYRKSTDWSTLPTAAAESALRVSDLSLVVGGSWNGTSFSGGRTLSDEIRSLEYRLQNGQNIFYAPGGTGDYANGARRNGRVQAVRLDREMRDAIMDAYERSGETVAIRATLTGAEYEDGYAFEADLVLPLAGITEHEIANDDRWHTEGVTFKVLQHATYGSVVAYVQNQVATYAAAA